MIRAVRIAAAALIGAALLAPASALGWANNFDNYGTHDWILDQALKVLDGRVDDWLDHDLALVHTDDPDYTRDPDLERAHLPRRGTRGRGRRSDRVPLRPRAGRL